MTLALILAALFALAFALIYHQRSYLALLLLSTGAAAAFWWGGMHRGWVIGFGTVAGLLLLLALAPLRRALVSRPLLGLVRGVLPRMGETERIALEAGTVWWDGEFFSGSPRWKRMLDFQVQPLS